MIIKDLFLARKNNNHEFKHIISKKRNAKRLLFSDCADWDYYTLFYKEPLVKINAKGPYFFKEFAPHQTFSYEKNESIFITFIYIAGH